MQEYKGMRVFPPEKHRQLTRILNGWTVAAQERGFLQYKTPLIDPIDLYTNKTSEEIVSKQTYRFTDRGGREVLLRPEITPGASAMVVGMQKNRTLKVPFKGFTIGSVFRYENPQKGRTREHIQFNADIFGTDEVWADAEVIEIIFSSFTHIGLKKNDFIVRINDRRAIESSLSTAGVPDTALRPLVRLLDRRGKINADTFEKELHMLTDVSVSTIDKALSSAPKSVEKVMQLLTKEVPAVYDPGIVRGFDYYTGVVFEVYAKDTALIPRSIAGGGRYDTLIESYGGTPISAVGFGMGDVALLECLDALSVAPTEHKGDIALCTTGNASEAYQQFTGACRGLPALFLGSVDGKKIKGVYTRCERDGIQYLITVTAKGASVRNLRTRKTTEAASVTDAVEKVLSARSENAGPSPASNSMFSRLSKLFSKK